jgi:bifunctional DNA-binding transcriptional regulator/antitoxin component of YhaV-PrlF toxin-antitoxin module
MLINLKQKSQLTIPKGFVERLKLRIGDKLEIEEMEGKLVITPVVVVPKDQAWFYSPEWQKKEQEVDKQKKEGKVHKASNKKELFKKLGLNKI